MTVSLIQAELADFVAYCTEEGGKSSVELLMRCDGILAVIHELPALLESSDYPNPPEQEYTKIRKCISAVFPDFGFYNLPETVLDNIGTSGIMVGDAIDDLTDTVGEFTEVLWRFENTSVEDAICKLRFGYSRHWGRHIRNLQFYLERMESGN